MTALDERVADDGRVRRRIWPLVLALSLLLAAAAGGAYVLLRTSVIGVRTVEVSGAAGSTQDVLAAVDVPVGTPMAGLNLGTVRDRVLAVPQVSDAQVSRQWPHTLRVVVQLRVPVAVTQANGKLWLLDRDGRPYETVAAAPAGLLTIELATPGAGDPATMAALTVIGSLGKSFLPSVAAVKAPTPYEVSLVLKDGRTVIWGDDSDGARKMQVLPAVLTRPGTVFDISDPTMVTVR